jgi:hypothetical protein
VSRSCRGGCEEEGHSDEQPGDQLGRRNGETETHTTERSSSSPRFGGAFSVTEMDFGLRPPRCVLDPFGRSTCYEVNTRFSVCHLVANSTGV